MHLIIIRQIEISVAIVWICGKNFRPKVILQFRFKNIRTAIFSYFWREVIPEITRIKM